MRQYALEQLAAAGEEAALRAAHARHVLELVDTLAPQLTTSERRGALDRLDIELDNIRQALRWSRAEAPAQHVLLAGALCWYWFSSRHWSEGRELMEAALRLPVADVPDAARGSLLFAVGLLATLRATRRGRWRRSRRAWRSPRRGATPAPRRGATCTSGMRWR